MESGLKGLSKHHVCLFACSCRPDPSRSSTMIHDHVLTSDLRPHTCILSPPPNPSVPTSQRRVLKNAVMGALFLSYGFLLETKVPEHGKTRTNIFDFSRRKKSRIL